MVWPILKPGRLVLIRWLDAHQPWEAMWMDPHALDAVELEPVSTVGFVQGVSKTGVRLVQTTTDEAVNGLMIIPLKGIVSVVWLGADEPGDCDR